MRERVGVARETAAPTPAPEVATPEPASYEAGVLMRLQASAGNQATLGLINRAASGAVSPITPTIAPVPGGESTTGLPDNLKSGLESLSGMDLSDVKVHYNSTKPQALQAHAYAQGTDIHVASGQEQHLPHEAWHVVQQKQGRVKPTMQL